MSARFPITEILPRIRSHLLEHPRLVLEAPPGAGKTTQVPLALLNESWCRGKKILLLEPRRVAARAAAIYMASQLGEQSGATVGYRIRFESRVSAATRIEVVTEGILTRMLQDDPLLEGVGAIIFDEFHERHIASDLGLALALEIQQQLRSDLRLIVMSATLDGEKLAAFMQAGRISSPGRSFPVTTSYLPALKQEELVTQVRRAVHLALDSHPGEVLVFLPGQREIRQVLDSMGHPLETVQKQKHGTPTFQHTFQHGTPTLQHGGQPPDFRIVPLYGDLPVEQQAAALAPDPEGLRRVVLATNVAESSVTLPGVRVVIDTGLAREPRFDPNTGFSRLETVFISRASADQRQGRAGRVAEGWCYRLWDTSRTLEATRKAEIATTDLSSLALELAAWGNDKVAFYEAPPAGALAAARDLLVQLGGLDSTHAVTKSGQRMLALGTHPRLAAMLLAGSNRDDIALACDLAALLEGRDPLTDRRNDVLHERWQVLATSRNRQNTGQQPRASRQAIQALTHSAAQWRKRMRCATGPPPDCTAQELGALLMHAFPDRIARSHAREKLRYQLANGRTAFLSDDSRLSGEPWLVITELLPTNRDTRIVLAVPVDEALLRQDFPERFVEEDIVRWDNKARALLSVRESRFDSIMLNSKLAGKPDPAQAAAALCNAVAQLGLDCLPWTDKLQQWRTRVNCLREWLQDVSLPDLTDAALLQSLDRWLLPAFTGKTRLDALSTEELEQALHTLTDWNQRKLVDDLAPIRLLVPSGLERPVTYHPDGPPVLSVKLQELFGLAETPRIAKGRVAVVLHLLSPGGKPLQITSDLHSFWERTYPEVKKEMKGRYPKHPWPDDPWNAPATHRAKPRSK